MITEFDQFKTFNGDWVIIIRHDTDFDQYSSGPSVWYETDGGSEPWPDIPGRERLVHLVEGGLIIPQKIS